MQVHSGGYESGLKYSRDVEEGLRLVQSGAANEAIKSERKQIVLKAGSMAVGAIIGACVGLAIE